MNAPDLIDTCHAPALRGEVHYERMARQATRRERNHWIATLVITMVFSFLCALEFAGVIR